MPQQTSAKHSRTRVVLSHGGHALTEEKNLWPLRIALAGGIVAMFARLTAPFTPNSFFSHLAWGAVLWIAGMAIWGACIFLRIKHHGVLPASK